MTVGRVRSSVLVRSVALVIEKLATALDSGLAHHTYTVGLTLAQKLSLIASSWGNTLAHNWATDLRFARFLAVCRMNTPNSAFAKLEEFQKTNELV